MISKIVSASNTFESWRDIARTCITAQLKPSDILWSLEGTSNDDLFAIYPAHIALAEASAPKVPRQFLEIARRCVCHSDPERFALLYQLLIDCEKSPQIIENYAAPLVAKVLLMSKSVSRDMHKMKAFVRFKEDLNEQAKKRRFTAWFEPEHYIVEQTSDFFVNRFHDMDWAIATPKGSAFYANNSFKFDPAPAPKIEAADDTEELWKIYYANIFNPARLKLKAMRSEMPKKYWHNMPEAVLIPELVRNADKRVADMRKALPSTPSPFAEAARASTIEIVASHDRKFTNLAELNTAARTCQRCPIYCNATQTVMGEGNDAAKLMIVGEQPGDEEDLVGRPFVGPSGKLLDEVLRSLNIDRQQIYLTNAVKHFKFEPRSKRRIHQRPHRYEIEHCKYWLLNEIDLIKPKLIVAMGATAAGVVTGSDKDIGARRGHIEKTSFGAEVIITFHPAAILRAISFSKAQEMRQQFSSDLKKATLFSRRT